MIVNGETSTVLTFTIMAQGEHAYRMVTAPALDMGAFSAADTEDLKRIARRTAEDAAELYDGIAYVLVYEQTPDGEIIQNSPRYIVGYDAYNAEYRVPEDYAWGVIDLAGTAEWSE